MSEMILFENKKIILFCDRITFIYMCDIKSISYTKWRLKNYFLTYGEMETPGVFYIRLKGKFIFEKRIAFRVKYDKAKEIISKIKFKVDFKE